MIYGISCLCHAGKQGKDIYVTPFEKNLHFRSFQALVPFTQEASSQHLKFGHRTRTDHDCNMWGVVIVCDLRLLMYPIGWYILQNLYLQINAWLTNVVSCSWRSSLSKHAVLRTIKVLIAGSHFVSKCIACCILWVRGRSWITRLKHKSTHYFGSMFLLPLNHIDTETSPHSSTWQILQHCFAVGLSEYVEFKLGIHGREGGACFNNTWKETWWRFPQPSVSR